MQGQMNAPLRKIYKKILLKIHITKINLLHKTQK